MKWLVRAGTVLAALIVIAAAPDCSCPLIASRWRLWISRRRRAAGALIDTMKQLKAQVEAKPNP